MTMVHLSIVIPVYLGANCLHELYERLRSSLESISSNFEILFVEDCGADQSWEIISQLAQKDPRVKGIQFSRNFGQHYGITAGMDHARGDWVVVMDCDLQDRPEEIPALYAKAQEGHDIVLARRVQRKDPILKRIISRIFYKLFSYLADLKYDGQVGNFRIMSRPVVNGFCMFREQLRFFGGIIQWVGFRSASIEVEHDERFHGKSSYTYRKLWKLATDAIIAYSDKPLRLAIRLGFILSSCSLGFAAYIFYSAMRYGYSIVGWASLMVSLYFIGGIIIVLLGIIGIYLGKTFDESKRRPLYLVAESINLEI